MERLYIFQCNKKSSRYGFTLDSTGGQLPVLDCDGWTYLKEVGISKNSGKIMGVPSIDIMHVIDQIEYYIHETEITFNDSI